MSAVPISEQEARRMLRADPADPDAWAVLLNLAADAARTDLIAQFFPRLGLARPSKSLANAAFRLASLAGDAAAFGLTAQLYARANEGALALESQRLAVAAAPDHPDLRADLGLILSSLGEHEAGAEEIRLAVAAGVGDHPGRLCDMGRVLKAARDFGGALALFNRALDLDPQSAAAAWERFSCHFNLGMLAEGWRDYEKRFEYIEAIHGAVRLPGPRWAGEKLRGRRLRVWREQGVGDELRFASCFKDLANLDGPILIECDPRLESLLRRSFQNFEFLPTQREDGKWLRVDPQSYDLQIAAGSLPAIFRPRLDSFPPTAAYLKADPDQRVRARAFLSDLGPGPKVGLCWRGLIRDADRTAAYYSEVANWTQALAPVNAHIVSLQYGAEAEELAAGAETLGRPLFEMPGLDLRNDFEGLAGLMGELDAIICVDTAIKDLAGGLGRPGLYFVTYPDWTLFGQGRSLWYPSLETVIRRTGEGTNEGVGRLIARLENRLSGFTGGQAAR